MLLGETVIQLLISMAPDSVPGIRRRPKPTPAPVTAIAGKMKALRDSTGPTLDIRCQNSRLHYSQRQ